MSNVDYHKMNELEAKLESKVPELDWTLEPGISNLGRTLEQKT